MQKFEDILNTAIERVRNGETVDSVISAHPEHVRKELHSMLLLARDFNSLPVRSVPAPMKRRRYIEHAYKARSPFVTGLRIFKNAYVASFMILLFGLSSTAYATFISLPGDSFFSLKKGVESVQLKFTTNPESRAELQLSLATRRLEEAQQVIYSSDSEETKNKAIEELNKQTSVALADIQEIASDPAVANNPKTAEKVQRAEELAKSQNTLVAAVNPSTATESSKTLLSKISTLKQVLATSIEQSSANIPTLAKIEKTDTVKSIKDGVITLTDGTTFEVNKDSTSIAMAIPPVKTTASTANKTALKAAAPKEDAKSIAVNNEENKDNAKTEAPKEETPAKATPTKISIGDINIGDTVSINGLTKDGKNYATEITLTAKAKPVEVKNVEPKKDNPAKEPSKDTIPKDSDKTSDQSSKPSADSQPEEKPQDTFGGFIVEPVNNPITVTPPVQAE